MASSKYVVRNLWNVAPFLTTNLVTSGAVDAIFNATLTKAALTAFDDYTSIRSGISSSQVDDAQSRTRRRKRTSSTRQDTALGSSATLRNNSMAPGKFQPTNDNMVLTDNDFFFEHQKTRGYRLASPAIADCDCAEKLQEDYIANAVAYYLDTVCGAKPLAELLLMGTGELSIDMWAAVQRGKVRNKQYHEIHY